MNLTDKYRPRTLADVLGQPDAVAALQGFAAEPHPHAFLFAGPTGTGKSSAALCLANDVGIDVDQGELSGLWQIASGDQTGETVRRAVDGLRVTPWTGSGWKLLLVNEADRMTEQAAFVWLDVLENLPAKAVVVFTTNDPKKMPPRLRDRCEAVRFDGSELALAIAVQELIAKVWKAELGRDDWPYPDELGDILDRDGNVSFRRVLQRLAPIIRAGGRLPVRPAALIGPICPVRPPVPVVPPVPVGPPVLPVLPVLAAPPAEKNVSTLEWVVGGALVLGLGLLAIAGLLMSDEPVSGSSGRRYRPDDLLR